MCARTLGASTRWAATAVGCLMLGSMAHAQPEAPRLVVVLVVDQMRADYADTYQHQWREGLRRLVDDGAWFENAAYPYRSTLTCAGHATIATGTFPSRHGMYARPMQRARPVNTGRGRRCGARVESDH